MRHVLAAAAFCCVFVPVAAFAAGPAPYGNLKWRSIGPALSGGRVPAVAGTDADPFLYYVGAAGGGVFKTTDGGQTWTAVFEKQPVAAIGAVAIAPSNENIVWVGTGEANPRNDVSYGDGVWVTTNGGKSWQHRGLDGTHQISKILVDPRNPNVALVGALGDAFADSPDRGVYRTTDGGKTWTKTLYVGPQSGVSDMAWDPSRPDVVFAGIWQYRRVPWNLTSGGPDDGLFKSTDGGLTWKKLEGHGLPSGLLGRIGVAVAHSDPKRVYALIQSKEGLLWRSDDGGDSWRKMTSDTLVDQRPFYFSHVYVDPKNADHLFTLALSVAESKNGGMTFVADKKAPHGDYHAMWQASDGRRIIAGDDGGPALSQDDGQTWSWPLNLAIGQIYHLGFDNAIPYNVCGGLQDNETFCGPSDSLDANGNTNHYWYTINGGDGMWVWPDPLDPSLIWNDIEDGVLAIFNTRTREEIDISPYPRDINGIAVAGLPYRFNWDSPIAFSPQDPHVAYYGGNVVFRTGDRGRHWTPVSPDLTLNDKSHQQVSGGPINADVSGAEFSDTILDIAPSALSPGLIWVGTDDGLVQLTRDGGADWSNVTMQGIAPYGRVEAVEPSHFSPAAAFVAVDRHLSGDRAPHLYTTGDYGASWTSIASNLPPDQYARTVRQDIHNANILYAGLEEGLWVSFDRGKRWQSLQLNLPTASISDLRIQPQFNDLIAATHGRSLWVLDDLAPVQQLAAAQGAGVFLFPPRTAYRFWRWSLEQGPDTSFAGDNADYGALISFYQSRPSRTAPSVEILDASGRVVRHLAGTHEVDGKQKPYVPNTAGINRFAWNISDDPPVKWLSAPKWNQGPDDGAEALPGTYTVRIHLDGRTLERPLVVKADPRLTWTAADYAQRHDFLARVFGEVSQIDTALNRIDSLGPQLEKLERNAPLAAQATAVAKRAAAINAVLSSNPKNEEDSILFADKLRERVLGLAFQIGSSSQPVWPAHEQQAAEIRAALDAAIADYNDFLATDVANLNKSLTAAKLPPLR